MAREPFARGRSPRAIVKRWFPSASIAVLAVVPLASGWPEARAVVTAAVLLALAVCASPLVFPRPLADAAARERADASAVPLIYWRPGCVYCMRLRLALGRIGQRAVWVDVSQDEEASARVRDVNGGDETVPTVFLDDSSWVNPAPSRVRAMLKAG